MKPNDIDPAIRNARTIDDHIHPSSLGLGKKIAIGVGAAAVLKGAYELAKKYFSRKSVGDASIPEIFTPENLGGEADVTREEPRYVLQN